MTKKKSRTSTKELRYHNISSLINNGAITKFSDIIIRQYVPVSVLAKDLRIHYNKLNGTDQNFTPHNFRVSHILEMSQLFEVDPVVLFKLILADNVKEDVNTEPGEE